MAGEEAPREITVHKLDHAGRSVWQYPGLVLARTPHSVCLEARFNRDDLDLGYTVFRRGDRFVEFFFNDRWYNVFAVYDRDDQSLRGWYCNVCRPARLEEAAIWCEDLALDLWVTPAGHPTILDEPEFAALPLRPAERRSARAGLTQLLALAAAGALPR